MASTELQKINSLLRKYRWRIRLHDGWLLAQRTLWLALAVVLLAQIVGRLWPVKYIDTFSVIVLLGWLLFVVLFSLLKPLPALRTAWRVDHMLNIKEKVSSAILFESAAWQKHDNETTREMITLQRADALETLSHSTPKQAFQLAWLKRPLIIAGSLLFLSVLAATLPNPMDALLAERAEIAAAAEAEAEKIEELRQEIEEAEKLSEEEREELLRELEALADQLRENNGDRAEALAALSEAEQALKDRLNPQADLRQAALESLQSKLNSLAQQLTDMSDNSDASIEEALDALLDEMGNMDQEELDNLAQSLQQLAAQAAQAGDASLAEALSALSQAAQSGEVGEAQAAASEVSEAAGETASELSDQEALEQALSQLQQSRQALSQSGQTADSGDPGDSSSNGQPQSGQSGQGQQPGQGQNGQGQSSGGGGGTNADSLPPNTSSGQASSPQGQGQSPQAGSDSDQVFTPWERLNGDVDPLTISGQDTGQGQDQVSEQDTPLPGTSNGVSVPYQDVYGSYLDSAYETIDQSYIPANLKDYVLEYFSVLEPDN